MSTDILPDSRLANPNSFVGDWTLPDGTTVRLLVENVYCCSCGKLFGLCPSENMVDVVCTCRKCFEAYGAELDSSVYVSSTDEFCEAVGYEMQERYGRTLTDVEILNEAKDSNLGPALEALMRDSPFPCSDSEGFGNRPKR
jgi:hypothetical protein